jgi:hypothetical protein
MEKSRSVTIRTSMKNELEFRVSYWQTDTENKIASVINIYSGACDLHASITPLEARQLAAQLLDHAADVETSQIALDEQLEAA